MPGGFFVGRTAMIEIPVYNPKGEKLRSEKLDPELVGGKIRHELLKQAIVSYRANQRQGTAATKNRAMIAGSTRKLYRQKGTGRARAGPIRTPTRRGGGRAFKKITRDLSIPMPRGMRRLARNSAILAKAQNGTAMIVDGLAFSEPSTKQFATCLRAVKADRGAVFAIDKQDANFWKSGRNIPNVAIKLIGELNAYDVLKHRSLIFSPGAFAALVADPATAGSAKVEE